jgi:hypothetical protein
MHTVVMEMTMRPQTMVPAMMERKLVDKVVPGLVIAVECDVVVEWEVEDVRSKGGEDVGGVMIAA